MKMTIRQALDYIKRADGMEYTKELDDKITNLLDKLPHNPDLKNLLVHEEGGLIRETNLVDYEQGWYVKIHYWRDVKKNMFKLEIIDGDGINPNRRVKSNKEAMELLSELYSIKSAIDIDEYWMMSDDYGYADRMRQLDMKAEGKRNQIKQLLII